MSVSIGRRALSTVAFGRWRRAWDNLPPRARIGCAVVALALVAALVAVPVVAGSTDGPVDCSAGSSVNIVAHPDDDLVFLNPATLASIRSGSCMTTVYVTSGDSGGGAAYARDREAGVAAAYAQMAGVTDAWTSTTVTIADHDLTGMSLDARRGIRLFFLRLPDGNLDGRGTVVSRRTSLQFLYTNEIFVLQTVDSPLQTYTWGELVETLGGLITSVAATEIRTMDHLGEYGDGDHSDHHTVAKLSFEAHALTAPAVPIAGYLGYPVAQLPQNVSGSDLAAKLDAFAAYAAHDGQMCRTLIACSRRPEWAWLQRQYLATQLRASPPSGGPGNAALRAVASASSENPDEGQTAAKAIDGVADGHPGDQTVEWVTDRGGVGSWLQLDWPEPVRIDRVVLHDRPNDADQITGATLRFSDGSTVSVPALDNAGRAVTVPVDAGSTTSMRLTVTSVSGTTRNVGLAEVQAWTADGG